MKIRVLVADDHAMFRQVLAEVLSRTPDIEVVGQAGNGAEAQHRTIALRPDVVLMDLSMPGVDGITATKWLSDAAPWVRVLVLTMYNDDEHLFEALTAGAHGYIVKSASIQDLVTAIRDVKNGLSPIDPTLSVSLMTEFRRLANRRKGSDRIAGLTRREIQALRLVAQGLSNKEIGARLCVAERTVKNYLTNIFRKIGTSDRVQAALYAHRNGLLADEPAAASTGASEAVVGGAVQDYDVETTLTKFAPHRSRRAK